MSTESTELITASRMSNYDIVAKALLDSHGEHILAGNSEKRRWQIVMEAVPQDRQDFAKILLSRTEMTSDEVIKTCQVGSKVHVRTGGHDYETGARAGAELLGKVYVPPSFEREYPSQLVLDEREYAAGAEMAKLLGPLTQHPTS